MSPQLRIAAVYVLISALWIWLSDRALHVLLSSEGQVSLLQSVKGGAFVLATGALLYWMVRRDMRRLHAANQMLLKGHQQSMRVIVSAMDIRHRETGDHSER